MFARQTKVRGWCWAAVATGALIGCSSPDSPLGSSGGAAGQSAVSGSSGAGPTGGAPAAAGAPATAGQGGSAAGAGGGAGGMMQTSAGAGGMSMSGASGSGGGMATAGASGGSNNPQTDVAALAPLNGFQLLDPCTAGYQVKSDPGDVCPQLNEVKNQHVSLHLAGDANVTYIATLRVRGVVERYWYEGGTLDPVSKVFYTDGVPTIGGMTSACKNHASDFLPVVLPPDMSATDDCYNGFNIFGMSVSAPKHHYFLNYTADKSGDRQPHAVYKQDYTVDVEMQGQATLDFYIIGSDEHQCYNHDQVIDGVKLSMSPYIGEFLQFDVTSVKRK